MGVIARTPLPRGSSAAVHAAHGSGARAKVGDPTASEKRSRTISSSYALPLLLAAFQPGPAPGILGLGQVHGLGLGQPAERWRKGLVSTRVSKCSKAAATIAFNSSRGAGR